MTQWPPHSTITCFREDNVEVARSKRSRLDLADTLMLHYKGQMPVSFFIEVKTKAESWTTWKKKNVKKIEDHIEYDLTYDGYITNIERVTNTGRLLCRKPFRWKVTIDVEQCSDEEIDITKVIKGTRFKTARSDASVKTIQKNIEKVFGLPKGSVCLLTPENNKCRPQTSIKKLRSKWKQV